MITIIAIFSIYHFVYTNSSFFYDSYSYSYYNGDGGGVGDDNDDDD